MQSFLPAGDVAWSSVKKYGEEFRGFLLFVRKDVWNSKT